MRVGDPVGKAPSPAFPAEPWGDHPISLGLSVLVDEGGRRGECLEPWPGTSYGSPGARGYLSSTLLRLSSPQQVFQEGNHGLGCSCREPQSLLGTQFSHKQGPQQVFSATPRQVQ